MSFTSPWQSNSYVGMIALGRRLLRPWPTLEARWVNSLVQAQNQRVHRHLKNTPAESVLLIMPRCVKKTGCKADVQKSLDGCLTCQDCPLGDVARLCDERQVKALVAFRSHIAFDIARQEQPDLIIATACHDRLHKALRNVPDIPALLAPLMGMERQCVNAGVDLPWLAHQLEQVAPRKAKSQPAPVGKTAPTQAGCPCAPLTTLESSNRSGNGL